MALETRQTAVTSAASAPAGVPRVSSAGQDYQAGAKAAGGDGSQVPSQCALALAAQALATDEATAAHDSAIATQEAAAEATECTELSASLVIEGSESAPLMPAVMCKMPESMLLDSALQAAAGADLEETVDHEVAQTVDELITAAVADFFALDNGASQPADPAMASSGAVPANMHDSFSAPTQGAAGSAGISPAAVVSVALAAGTGSVCRSDRAIHGSSATSMRLLPHSDLTVSQVTAEGYDTVAAHSAEAQNAKGQAPQGHGADAHSTDAAQDTDAHAHSAAVHNADGQHAQHQAANAHITQAQPAEAHIAEAADAEAHSWAGDTAQAYSAEGHIADADMPAACTAQVTFAAVQLTEQAVTTAAPDDATACDTAETQPQARQLADSQPSESAPLELTQSPEVTHSAAESAENSLHNAALSLSRLRLHMQFMHEREAVREREVEQMRQQVTEMEDACKVAVEREVGYRKDQIARLQCGKQVCYGSQG